eukprot:TRINITY_DN1249_c0_g1_i6.p1 TRINITY_DN1249_c0_g1~~TRINITY_DN1249_c0_g1_i6.p1  ORF type:complete len:311 (-),score=47.28 TRINITY_DN1249_c0_g1_i6:435-1331(-)
MTTSHGSVESTVVVATEETGGEGDGSLFDLLPDENLVKIASYLICDSLSNVAKLARIDSRWSRICQSDELYRLYLVCKFGLGEGTQKRLQANILVSKSVAETDSKEQRQGEEARKNGDELLEVLKRLYIDDSWKRKCLRLLANMTEFVGYGAEQAATIDHAYTMNLMLANATDDSGETIGLLHWKSLGDSLTWVNGTDRFNEKMPYDYQAFFDVLHNTRAPATVENCFRLSDRVSCDFKSTYRKGLKRIAFVETDILRGRLVATPNWYRGLQHGAMISGWFYAAQEFSMLGLWTGTVV